MICIHCRLELYPDYEVVKDDSGHPKQWIDKSWGEAICPTPTDIPGVVHHEDEVFHTPAYEISGALLDDIVEALGELAEVLDRIGEEDVEQAAQLAEIVSTEPKLVER